MRETYVAGAAAEMLRKRQVGAAKLDLVLRGIALWPEHAGQRTPGLVLRRNISYEDLHDLCRDPHVFTMTLPEDAMYDPEIVDKKREWVRAQLQILERRKLVRRVPFAAGRRPDIIVLRDDGSEEEFDDPGARAGQVPGNSYVNVHGPVISDPRFGLWGAPELAAYYCAMTAERFDPQPPSVAGTGEWCRPVGWFGGDRRPSGHVTYPFGERTIRTGLLALEEQGWISMRMLSRWRGSRFARRRRVVANKFVNAKARVKIVDLANHRTGSPSKKSAQGS
ncbi:hypothetical protein [Ilumatobacter fluminis]|uniref:hypothetical protein n=1 Tax=Ilumatobacter fluminis TaxID=467091 RepID=UPI00105E8826|nr:hypothetical protein [Ilumatobacter fluminis]